MGGERAHERIVGGEEGRRERLGGHIESLGLIKGVETLLPRHAVGVERAAEVEEQRFDRRHRRKPVAGMDSRPFRPRPRYERRELAATFAFCCAALGSSNGTPSMNALHASCATLSRNWRGGLFM